MLLLMRTRLSDTVLGRDQGEMNLGKTKDVRVGEMKAEERTETGAPQVREVGK